MLLNFIKYIFILSFFPLKVIYGEIISLGCECQALQTTINSPHQIKKEDKQCNKFIDMNIDVDNQTIFTQTSFFTHYNNGHRFNYYEDGYDIRFEKIKNFEFEKNKIHTSSIEYRFGLNRLNGNLNIYQETFISYIDYGAFHGLMYNFSCKILDKKDLLF